MPSYLTSSTPPLAPSPPLTPLFRNPEFRIYPRRKSKPLLLRFSLPNDFLSLLPPAALGFASALALSNYNSNSNSIPRGPIQEDLGEWILFTSPTPFNRFVLLRCPSLSLQLDNNDVDISRKLLNDDRHYIGGEIQPSRYTESEGEGELVEYQRECVRTEDGGVVSLDWPAHLDLRDERGLDTTVLLVPGTVQGSSHQTVRWFVAECLKRGLFPVVVNPRGCARSPITTPRLFSAADSDDICSAIQFVTKARPWSTLTGVGWGYGANMLTKYLAEAGEKTPLTAATCIDNPFDLDEATRTAPYSGTIDKKLTRGLKDILQSNKELFQGRGKGFDVDKALSAESVRDFDEAISMVSYGFDTLEEFYSNSSTRSVVEKLKIPVLFIQNDNGTVPLFSIPRSMIAENPFTSLLLCSCLPSNVNAISWYQQVTIEWLTAVELGLLKGRHPLLQDIDVTINPSKGLSLVEGRTSDSNSRLDSFLDRAELDSSSAYIDSVKKMLPDDTAKINLTSNQISQRKLGTADEVVTDFNGALLRSSSVDANAAKDMGNDVAESDRGQVLQTAEVVMNMLDVTMPGTLKEEEKKKVLAAVGQGETLIKALQDAVPEDVRGKLTTSVSEILQAQGKNLNFGLLSIDQIANVSSGLRSKISERASKSSDTKTENKDHPSDQKVGVNDPRTSNDDNQTVIDKSVGAQTEEKSPQYSEVLESKSVDNPGDDTGLAKGSTELQNTDDKLDNDSSAKKKLGQLSDVGEEGSETTSKMSSSSQNGGGNDSEGPSVVQNNRAQDDEPNQLEVRESDMSAREGTHQDLSNDPSKTSSPAGTSEIPASPSADGQQSEKGGDDSKSKDEKPAQPLADQNKAVDTRSPSFNVSQALDALTGLDDSTQVAVNSVFGVIEEMITQLEEKKNGSTVKEGKENNDALNNSGTEKSSSGGEPQLEKQTAGDDEKDGSPQDMESTNRIMSDRKIEQDPTTSPDRKENSEKQNEIVEKLATQSANGPSDTNEVPPCTIPTPYTEAFYNECLQKYILSKLQNGKPLNLDTTTALFINYNPEEGKWLLLEKPGGASIDRMRQAVPFTKQNVIDNVIEPSYVILDSERDEEPDEELKEESNVNHECNSDESKFSVRTIVLESLKVEVRRRLSATDMKEMEAGLGADMEEVVNAVYSAIQHDKEHNQNLLYPGYDSDDESSGLVGNRIVEAISVAVQNTSYLKRVLPVGVIVGSTLAALRNFFNEAAMHENKDARALYFDQDNVNRLKPKCQSLHKAIELPAGTISYDPVPENNSGMEEEYATSDSLDEDVRVMPQSKTMNRDTLVVGAVTAALGASALLTSQQEDFMGSNTSATSSSTSNQKDMKKEAVNLQDLVDDKHQSNIMTSLAEKAMSVAAPVVPTKEDGEVDQERLVAMLAELGQKGGMLRLIGKLALLWGGLRGAMSLTDRLFSFLRIAERPLLQRVLGFFSMVLVLWSPVLVPLLPTLFHNWATHNSSRIAELACILGLYAAVTILIMQWGKRIRGHEYPLKQYGLDFNSSTKIQDFLSGLVGGVMLVLSIQSVNALLGYVNFSLPSHLTSSSLDVTAKFKAYGQLFLLAAQGIVTAAGVAFVEELLFRSWLPEEIAADLGYHPGILLSGLVFALSQRSLFAIPGLWLLSLSLAGVQLRKHGSLFIPIGLRTGIMASSYILQMSGFLYYQPKFHRWIAGLHPLQPFSGAVGLLFALLLAVALYPRRRFLRAKMHRTIRA